MIIEDVKTLIGLNEDEIDIVLETKLEVIIDSVKARLKARLGGIEPPEEMDYIITEASVKRFNQIGSEGITSHSVDGESTKYDADIFAGFEDDIQNFLDSLQNRKGKVRFL